MKSLLIISKSVDLAFAQFVLSLSKWLLASFPKLRLTLDARLKVLSSGFPESQEDAQRVSFWDPGFCAACYSSIDFIVTLGGDGTVLYASWLFQKCAVPPVMPFYLGSLGFLTEFDIAEIKDILQAALEPSKDESASQKTGIKSLAQCSRMRLSVTLFRHRPIRKQSLLVTRRELARTRSNTWTSLDGSQESSGATHSNSSFKLVSEAELEKKKKNLSSPTHSPKTPSSLSMVHQEETPQSVAIEDGGRRKTLPKESFAATTSCFESPYPSSPFSVSAVPVDTFHVLNEVVVDRGPSAYMSQLELFVGGKHLTSVQADGLVLSTPTGSTAYSLSAGGSLVHPQVGSILVTPICPHSLSFRPMILPDTVDIRVQVPLDSRYSVWASFDGKHRIELNQGDSVVVTRSPHPMLTLSSSNLSNDWFESVSSCLHWNTRARQKPLESSDEDTVQLLRTVKTLFGEASLSGVNSDGHIDVS